ncbi:NADH-dependent formate dehydrogenase delta subunit FdsD [Palleronia aestuarii]|uniref:NADH-dependent formate dehydrogenase delta subunit FdsD n=1 Tax=Palleronia aestuarii TaxID=568105 RepID=A0A2W7NA78_9RHOB|nr:formate dehydrogenase subunit delta [Palleronia aestuarii]PZX16978.1 NADH-dependent formate dehydrogenase delta subunit FdsD [Palleronia aestuarii]
MRPEKLVGMANQISLFMESKTDRDEALEGLAAHINDFWDPRMRRQFVDAVSSDDDLPARDLVRRALPLIRLSREDDDLPGAPKSPAGSEPINPAHRD